MATPRIPSGFKPLIRGYTVGSPDSVVITEVAGGMPRVARQFARGAQQFSVSMNMRPGKFSVWNAFFTHIIDEGGLSFLMPLDSGFGLQDHKGTIVPRSYAASRADNSQITVVSFQVLAVSAANDMTKAEAQAMVDLWNEYGDDYDALLRRIAQFANVDTTVLDF